MNFLGAPELNHNFHFGVKAVKNIETVPVRA